MSKLERHDLAHRGRVVSLASFRRAVEECMAALPAKHFGTPDLFGSFAALPARTENCCLQQQALDVNNDRELPDSAGFFVLSVETVKPPHRASCQIPRGKK